MQNTVIAWHIRRVNRNLLWTNLVLVGIFTGVALLSGSYLFNFLLGPFPADRKKLLTLTDDKVPFEYYLKVNYGDQKPILVDKEVEQRVNKNTRAVISERVTAEFYVVDLSEKRLIFKVAPGTDFKSPLTGTLTQIPNSMRSGIADGLRQHKLELHEAVVPLMLDTGGFRWPGYWGLAIGLPLYAFGVWNIVRALKRGGRLERHPIAQALSAYGEPAEIAEHIHQETNDPARTFAVGKLQLTSSWLLQPSTYGLTVIHMSDVLWIYKKVTKHSTNGIPTGTTHAVMINTRNGGGVEVPASDGTTEQMLEELHRRAPWIIAGYSDELAALYKRDLAGVGDAVEERRQQVMAEINRPEGTSPPAAE